MEDIKIGSFVTIRRPNAGDIHGTVVAYVLEVIPDGGMFLIRESSVVGILTLQWEENVERAHYLREGRAITEGYFPEVEWGDEVEVEVKNE